MKKIIATFITLTMLTAGISGCTGNGNSDVSDSSGSAENSGNSGDSISEGTSDTAPAGTDESSENLPDISGRAAQMGAAAMEAVEWPSMMDVTDEETASIFFGIDLNMCEDYYFSNQLISAQLNEIVIAKPSAGNEDALKAAFDAHFEYIQNDAAFYPDQEASAAGAVSGTTEDGYYYIIVHENGADAAAAMLTA